MDSYSDEPTAESELEMARPSTMPEQIRQGITISGPFIPEAMEVLAVVPFGSSLKVIGRGTKTGRSYDPVLSPEQIAQLKVTGESRTLRRFRPALPHRRRGAPARARLRIRPLFLALDRPG